MNDFEIDGKQVFAFHVPESSRAEKPVYLKGDPRQSYLRRGAGDVAALGIGQHGVFPGWLSIGYPGYPGASAGVFPGSG